MEAPRAFDTTCASKCRNPISMTKEEFLSLVDKYEQGACTKKEEQVLMDFCAQVQVGDVTSGWDVSREERIRIKLLSNVHQSIREKENKERRKTLRRYIRAASVVLLMGVGWYYWFNLSLPTLQQQNQLSQVVTVQNGQGQLVKRRLPDGSLVHLSPNTSISYDSIGFADDRLVRLSGQAFFEVFRNEQSPFRVAFGESRVTVLGTKFNVNTKEGAGLVLGTVAVLEGKVRVENRERQGVLTKGQQIKILNDRLDTMEATPFLLNWHTGKLVFKSNALSEVVDLLEQTYGSKIELKVSLRKKYLTTAKYDLTNLETVVSDICFVHQLKYQIGPYNTITITEK